MCSSLLTTLLQQFKCKVWGCVPTGIPYYLVTWLLYLFVFFFGGDNRGTTSCEGGDFVNTSLWTVFVEDLFSRSLGLNIRMQAPYVLLINASATWNYKHKNQSRRGDEPTVSNNQHEKAWENSEEFWTCLMYNISYRNFYRTGRKKNPPKNEILFETFRSCMDRSDSLLWEWMNGFLSWK